MALLQYIVNRLILMIPTFLLVMIIIFLLVRLLPGDPAIAIAGDRASDADLAAIRERLGLNEPLLMQFWLFLINTLKGDLGTSILMRAPVIDVIMNRLPTTVFLTVYAVLLSLVIAGPLAFVAALNRGRWPDNVIRSAFQVGLSMPVFYIGLILLTFLAAQLRWFPVGGYGETLSAQLYHLFLPAIAVALYTSAIIMRNLRSSVIEVLDAEYVQFARAKGLPVRLILGRARAAQRADLHHHAGGAFHRKHDERNACHGDGLCGSRRRAPHAGSHIRPRLSPDPGPDADLRSSRLAGVPSHRSVPERT